MVLSGSGVQYWVVKVYPPNLNFSRRLPKIKLSVIIITGQKPAFWVSVAVEQYYYHFHNEGKYGYQ